MGEDSSATLIPEPPAATGPSKEDIAKVIQEHKKKEADRADKAKQTEKQDAEEKGKGDSKDSEESKPKPASSPSPPSTIHIPESSAPTPSKHRRFALHRGIFSMRERDVRSREHVAKAKEVGKGESSWLIAEQTVFIKHQTIHTGLPQVPRGQI